MHIENIIDYFYFRRKGLFIIGKNSSETKNSTYAEIETQRSGDTTYQELSVTRNQELTVSESDKAYENLEPV